MVKGGSTMTIHALGPFRLDTRHGLLLRGTEPVALGKRPIALLQALVERPGALVLKEALIEAGWSGRAVEESNLPVQIAALRRVLGAAAGGDRWIETLSGRGYRFVGPVVVEAENGVIAPAPIPVALEPAPRPYGGVERRQITAMSCELVDLSARADGLGLEDQYEAAGDFRRSVAQTVGHNTGFIARNLGNSVLVIFGYPEAHEHDPEHAVRAGLELCAMAGTGRPVSAVPMRCRVGIATGNAIIGDLQGGALGDLDIVGDVPHLAAQLRISAQPDIVAIDPTTRLLIGNLFDCRALGAIETGRGAESMRGYHVLGESLVASRFEALRGRMLSPLVGRCEEIDLLLRRWARAKAGDGQIVLVSGEAGIGKSRLAAALEERLRLERDAAGVDWKVADEVARRRLQMGHQWRQLRRCIS